MNKKLILGTILSLAACIVVFVKTSSLAQLIPQPTNEEGSLTILEAKCGEATATKVANMSCRIKNDSSKEVAAFTVLWTITSASDKPYKVSTTEDKSLVKSLKRLAPGDVVDCEAIGSVTTPAGDPFTKVEVSIDIVLFSDGSTTGKNLTNSLLQIQTRQNIGRYLRSQLLKIYRDQGVEALMRELSDSQINIKNNGDSTHESVQGTKGCCGPIGS